MDEEFTVTLFSDSEGMYDNPNTQSCFTNKLYKRLSLNGPWEVALLEITLPLTLCNIYGERCKAYVATNEINVKKRCILANNYCNNVDLVLNKLNEDLAPIYSFNLESGRVVCTPEEGTYPTLRLSTTLAQQLGFPLGLESYTGGIIGAPEAPNFNKGLPTQIFVNTDIVKQQFVGNKSVRLLRSVAIDINNYTFGGKKCFEAKCPIYLPVSHRDIEYITVQLHDERGHSLPFLGGSCTVLLHFRRSHS
jgi:hypothetical protein